MAENRTDISDINRHPTAFASDGWKMAVAEMEAIRFENCANCTGDCEFLDYMEPNSDDEVGNNSITIPVAC